MSDYQVVLIDLPVNEVVTKNEDDSCTIFINAKLGYEGQRKAFHHAVRHIAKDDFYKINVQEIESRTHTK